MEEVLVIVFQLFFEFLVQVVGSGLLDAASRGTAPKTQEGCGIFVLHAMVGGGLGFASTVIVPHLVLPFVWMRILNLVLAPLIAGGVSALMAAWLNRKGDASGPFVHGFLFALMFGLARFAFAVR